MTKYRSAASLLASGIATISLNQRLRAPRLKSTVAALESDRAAIAGDGIRAMKKVRDGIRAA